MDSERGINRKQSIQLLFVYAGGFWMGQKKGLLAKIDGLRNYETNDEFNNPKEIKPQNIIDSDTSYIAQKTKNSCAIAVMAMLIADEKNENVKDVYQKIVDYYELIDKSDVSLGALAIKDYLMKENLNPVVNTRKIGWDRIDIQENLFEHESTVFDVTSNYGEVIPEKNNPNHWIIMDEIISLDGRKHSLIRDPFRSANKFSPLEKLLPFMTPNENGSILIPNDILFPALGVNSIYIDNPSDNKLLQRHSTL